VSAANGLGTEDGVAAANGAPEPNGLGELNGMGMANGVGMAEGVAATIAARVRSSRSVGGAMAAEMRLSTGAHVTTTAGVRGAAA